VSHFDASYFETERQRRRLTLGVPLCAMGETDSTNDDALAAARAGAPEGATFVADFQRKGRGRGDSQWLAAPGENLTFSVLLRPKLRPEQAPHLTLAVGLAIRDAVQSLLPGEVVGIKWPNDVWVQQRKLAGVLLESITQAGVLSAVIAGVGLNVRTRTFPGALAQSAVSMSLLGNETRREELLLSVLEQLQLRVQQVSASGPSTILAELRQHDVLKGRRVQVDATLGTVSGLSDAGELIVETAIGTERVRAGHVVLLS
jgi:BirA family biotin operon repressor/biotin-[acetyl-CoA-carboxylase] ligase